MPSLKIATSSFGAPVIVTLQQQQKDFANVIKLKFLRRGNYPGLSGWALNVSHLYLTERGRGWSDRDRREAGSGTVEADI